MSIQYAPSGLIGLLTPQANTTAEIEFATLMPSGFAQLVARMTSTLPDLDARLIEYFERIDDTIRQFANAPLAAIAAACTGSSYRIGAAREDALFAALSARLGIPVTNAGLSVVQACQALDARRIALLSPYPDSLTEASVAYWKSRELEIVEVVRITGDTTSFHPIYSIEGAAAARALHALAGDRAQAIVMLGTGMPSLGTVLAQPVWQGAPVFSCMVALAWNAVRLANRQAADPTSLIDFTQGLEWGARYRQRYANAASRQSSTCASSAPDSVQGLPR